MTIEALTLDDPRALDLRVAGTKASGLAKLRTAGFDVPDGVVLPVGVAGDWTNGTAPKWVRDAVERACAELAGPLAVRSSATWEDGATSAHAGATSTELDVRGVDAALEAIRRCLDGTAVSRESAGARGDTAILLQRLVPAEWAGVAFTADPMTGEREVVRIAATPGLGEALVQGDVIGSDITVRGSTIEGDVQGMATEDVMELARVARAIEEKTGAPQDVEWAIVDGHVHVLQARPITVLPRRPELPSGNNWQKDVAHYPEPVTPFGWSVYSSTSEAIRSVFDETGLLVRGLEDAYVGGEIYGRVIPAFGSADDARNPPPAPILGLAARLVPELRRRNKTARHVVETNLMQRWVDDWHRRDRADMEARNGELGSVDLRLLDDAALADHLDELITHVQRGMMIHFRLMMPMFGAMHRLFVLVNAHLGWDAMKVTSMLSGHSPATRAAGEHMAQLRDRIRRVPGAVDALESDPRRPLDALRKIEPELADALQEWMDEHGWAMVNYDAGVPVLAERPAVVTGLLLSEPTTDEPQQADDVAAEARSAMPATRRDEFDLALDEARAIYPIREDNTIVVGDRPMALTRRWMLEVADRLVEHGIIGSKSDAAFLSCGELRQVLIDPSALDAAELIVRRRGEEAWMRANPGPLYIGEQGAPPDISKLPKALRLVNEPIMWAISHEYPEPTEVPNDTAVLLSGVAASPGVAEGPARVIRSHQEMDRLQAGDILVCQVTSPSWAPLFPLAEAIIADGGGVLSHAAIAAREHGIPAVLGTGTATKDLSDGQRVRVDGKSGLVYAID